MNKYIIAVLIVGLLFSKSLFSQEQGSIDIVNQPKVGHYMPDFTLDNVTHYRLKKVSLKNFEGQWLILDFWFPGCLSCIKNFPKISDFQKRFKDDVQFIAIGLNNQSFKDTQTLYEKLRVRQNLNLVSAYDSMLFENWNIWAMPYIIIIDPKGIVRFITDGRDMTADKLEKLFKGETVTFYNNVERIRFDANKFSIKSNQDMLNDKLIYRSILTKWNGEEQWVSDINGFIKMDDKYKLRGYNAIMIPLYGLYNQAYLGQWLWSYGDSLYNKIYPKPILELRDSSLFQFDYKWDVGMGTYNYSLFVPPSNVSRDYLMGILQNDLMNVFGYKVSIENRSMPVWKLIAKSDAHKKLQTKGGESYISSGVTAAVGFTARNLSIEKILDRVIMYISDNEPPFIDETGITGNIDITIDALMTDREDIRKALKKNGLDLVKGTKEMKVIVIRDPKPETTEQ